MITNVSKRLGPGTASWPIYQGRCGGHGGTLGACQPCRALGRDGGGGGGGRHEGA
ncbi:hypothetical protein Q5P01_013157 [Channa striata]|uniref:Uncharacterized protein n=1 Tax=Channa striata TaxID=64152 RepID=A0AA88MIV7_CHASR|nr:hypothetical protein Q5P01_013157 [Channa striata]